MLSTVHLLECHYFNYHMKAVAFISLPSSLQTKLLDHNHYSILHVVAGLQILSLLLLLLLLLFVWFLFSTNCHKPGNPVKTPCLGMCPRLNHTYHRTATQAHLAINFEYHTTDRCVQNKSPAGSKP